MKQYSYDHWKTLNSKENELKLQKIIPRVIKAWALTVGVKTHPCRGTGVDCPQPK